MATFKAPQEISEADRFKQKFPGQGMPRQSDFLRKKLQGKAGAKYFDSGDYNMAKSTTKNTNLATGKAIPTPDTLPQRKTSSTKQSNLVIGTPSSPKSFTAEEKVATGNPTTDGTTEQKSKQLITEEEEEGVEPQN